MTKKQQYQHHHSIRA